MLVTAFGPGWLGPPEQWRPIVVKLLEVKAKLFGGPQAAAVVALAAEYHDQPSEAEEVLKAFLNSTEPIGDWLEGLSRKAGSAQAPADAAGQR